MLKLSAGDRAFCKSIHIDTSDVLFDEVRPQDLIWFSTEERCRQCDDMAELIEKCAGEFEGLELRNRMLRIALTVSQVFSLALIIWRVVDWVRA